MVDRTPYAILDDQNRIIGVLAGRPIVKEGEPDDWNEVTAGVGAAIETAQGEMKFCKGDCAHRRGAHIARAYGWSHGGGQTVSGSYPIGAHPHG